MYKVINEDSEKDFSGKGQQYSMGGALDLYDSLGGGAAGYAVRKI